MKRRYAALLLAFAVTLALAPPAGAEETDLGNVGKMEQISPEYPMSAPVTSGDLVVASLTPKEIQWIEEIEEHPVPGWWVGVNIVSPYMTDDEQRNTIYTSGGADDWDGCQWTGKRTDEKGTRYVMSVWGEINPLLISCYYLTNMKSADYQWQFQWGGEEPTVGYMMRLKPSGVRLMKDKTECYPSNCAMKVDGEDLRATNTKPGEENDPITIKLRTLEVESAASAWKEITVKAIAPNYVDWEWIIYEDAPNGFNVNADGIAYQTYDAVSGKWPGVNEGVQIVDQNDMAEFEESAPGYEGRYCIEIPVTLNIRDGKITGPKKLMWRVDWDKDYLIAQDAKLKDVKVSEGTAELRNAGGFEQTYVLDLSNTEVKVKSGGSSGGNSGNEGNNPGDSSDPARVTLPSAVQYIPWKVDLNESGGFAGGKDFSLEGSPSWIRCRNGVLSGVPVSANTYTFTVSYTNKSGAAVKERVRVESRRASSANLREVTEENWDYRITDPAGDVYGFDGGCYLTSKGDYDDFRTLYLDGVELDEGTEFGVWPGSTVVEIYPKALREAGYGTHTVTLAFMDGAGEMRYAAQNFYISRTSGGDSGDNSPRVSVNNQKGGKARAYSNGEVAITVNSGYYIAAVAVNGKSVSVPANGRLAGLRARDKVEVTFEENVSRMVTAGSAMIWEPPAGTASGGTGQRFQDVAPGAYFYDAVQWAVSRNIAKGKGNRTFQPNGTCSRADMVTFLWRANGSPEPSWNGKRFTDVPSSSYYAKAVQWAADKELVKGEGKRRFNPNALVTRGEAVTFLYRAAGSPSAAQTVRFEDVRNGSYYLKPVAWALNNGIANGVSSAYFRPDAPCSRGDVMTFLYRQYR